MDINGETGRISAGLEANSAYRNGADYLDEASPGLALGVRYMF
ncbi:MAG: hypothetical protein QUS11_09090 [Candidatus Fermentibacter sp.]|nr:hypothetical protein [Candidatus Fermentibacter sp.]